MPPISAPDLPRPIEGCDTSESYVIRGCDQLWVATAKFSRSAGAKAGIMWGIIKKRVLLCLDALFFDNT